MQFLYTNYISIRLEDRKEKQQSTTIGYQRRVGLNRSVCQGGINMLFIIIEIFIKNILISKNNNWTFPKFGKRHKCKDSRSLANPKQGYPKETQAKTQHIQISEN